MKGFLAGITALLLSSSVLAAQVNIGEFSLNYPNSKEKQYRVPWITLHDNPDAARRINDFIFTRFIANLPGKDPQATLNRFASPETQPTAGLDYSVVNNNGKILTLDIFVEGCGTYCESRDEFISFDLKTGSRITLEDMVVPEALADINDMVRKDVRRQMTTFIERQKTRPVDSAAIEAGESVDYAEFYAPCLARTYEGKSYARAFSLAGNRAVFHNERCSNHASRALDELDVFTTKIPIADIADKLTPYGKNLLSAKPATAVAPSPSLNNHLAYGTLGEKIPVVLNINCREEYLDGAYFYRRYGAAIEVSGTCPATNDQPYIMTTWSEDGAKEKLTLTLNDGKFQGEWQAHGKTLPVEFVLP